MNIFWLHISPLAIYNALIGYLLVHREEQDGRGLFFSPSQWLCISSLLIMDYGLRHDHKETYRQKGRWVLAMAIVIGWGVELATKIHEAFIGVLFAFLAGGVVLNVLKEELPVERQSRFAPFALGAAFYALLLLLL